MALILKKNPSPHVSGEKVAHHIPPRANETAEPPSVGFETLKNAVIFRVGYALQAEHH